MIRIFTQQDTIYLELPKDIEIETKIEFFNFLLKGTKYFDITEVKILNPSFDEPNADYLVSAYPPKEKARFNISLFKFTCIVNALLLVLFLLDKNHNLYFILFIGISSVFSLHWDVNRLKDKQVLGNILFLVFSNSCQCLFRKLVVMDKRCKDFDFV